MVLTVLVVMVVAVVIMLVGITEMIMCFSSPTFRTLCAPRINLSWGGSECSCGKFILRNWK